MSRVMFIFASICTLVVLAMIVFAVLSFTGAFSNTFVDPGM